MKLKYYLRGLGIGVFFTALILIASYSQRRSMTDEEVIARAKELGMIENTVLKEKDDEPEQTPENTTDNTDAVIPDADAEDTAQDEAGGENTTVANDKPTGETTDTDDEATTDNEPVADNEAATDNEPTADSAEIITIQVQRGDSSVSVSRKAEEAGLVASAAEFDSYLCANGYDKKISVGTYEIQNGATEEEIAKIITKTN